MQINSNKYEKYLAIFETKTGAHMNSVEIFRLSRPTAVLSGILCEAEDKNRKNKYFLDYRRK